MLFNRNRTAFTYETRCLTLNTPKCVFVRDQTPLEEPYSTQGHLDEFKVTLRGEGKGETKRPSLSKMPQSKFMVTVFNCLSARTPAVQEKNLVLQKAAVVQVAVYITEYTILYKDYRAELYHVSSRRGHNRSFPSPNSGCNSQQTKLTNENKWQLVIAYVISPLSTGF